MKQLVQNYKNGKLELKNVPAPKLSKGNAIVTNYCSAVSIGTETLMIDLAKKTLAGKAFARPDLVKKVIEKLKNEGLKETYSQVMNRLDEPIALGYSSAGIIEKIDPGIEKFKRGDRVACSVPDYACHAETVRIPENLMARIPDNVDFEEACFSAIGAIAIHSIRLSEVTLNNRVAVIGLGLLGQIAVQVLNAMSCDVSGFEIDEGKIKLARKLGLERAIQVTDESLFLDSLNLTEGFGFDAVIIATNTPKSKKPVEMACQMAREKGKVVLLGQADISMDRKILFQKELDFKVSRSTGPGILDEEYISKGIEYPISYIRWTHKRNMETFLDLLSKNRINIKDLITHQFEFSEVLKAYDSILNSKGKYIGVYLKYQSEGIKQNEKKEFNRGKQKHTAKKGKGKINIGVIGAGLFAKTTLLPNITRLNNICLKGLADLKGMTGNHLAEKYKFEFVTTNTDDILNDKTIDGVFIVTDSKSHAALTIEALGKGKHVFVEKPLALNFKELENIKKAYQKSDTKLMVGFNRRFSPLAQKGFEFLSPIGGKYIFNIRVNVGNIPEILKTKNPVERRSQLINEVCHYLDLMEFYTDAYPEEASAECLSGIDTHKEEDNLIINIKFTDGSIGSLVYMTAGIRSYERERIEIFKGNSVYLISDFKMFEYCSLNTKKRKKYPGVDRGHHTEFKTFINSIIDGQNHVDRFNSYYHTTLTTFAVLESLKRNKKIKIKDLKS